MQLPQSRLMPARQLQVLGAVSSTHLSRCGASQSLDSTFWWGLGSCCQPPLHICNYGCRC